MGILAAVLWLNIPGIGGPIAGISILTLIFLYPFIALNKRSRLNMWLDEIAHKINMWSLTWFKRRKEKTPLKISETE
ncbi:MAG: hypothetical protein JW776_16400 [Candidatus Lokiarchaeota archaeon]|nr:hypothetical protein [Candidatus Lokiarchaeota archaeon]